MKTLFTLFTAVLLTATAFGQDIELNGTVSAQNNQIKNVADPTDDQDAVTKAYAETILSSQGLMNFNDWTNYQVTDDDTTVDLETNSFVFLNANNTNLKMPQNPNDFDVIYFYVVRAQYWHSPQAGHSPHNTFQANGNPITGFRDGGGGPGMIYDSTTTNGYAIGFWKHSGLHTAIFQNGQWFLGQFYISTITNDLLDFDGDGFTESDGDCEPYDPNTYPGALEICDGQDNDCDGEIDEDFSEMTTWYSDNDGDGFGGNMDVIEDFCPPDNYSWVDNNQDCDDDNPTVYPGAVEVLDGIDNDCDGQIDESTNQNDTLLNTATHWYFGNGAGLIFDTNSGTVLSTNAATSTISTSEGCSSISDLNGNLLFYTDGRNVWDKNHIIMPNANYNAGTGLLGDPSSTSSGLIIPKPGNTDQYYVFTVDEPHHQNAFAFPNQGPANVSGNAIGSYDSGGSVPSADDGFNNGLAYTLVDLTLNSGDGDVVTSEKNIQLLTYDPNDQSQAAYKCSEKITAVEHNDGQSYWVLTQFINKFYAFRVDDSGVNPMPVITTISPSITVQGYRRNGIGYMKASPDGSKIAVCHRQNGNSEGQNSSNTGSVWLYDFDNETGLISNPLNIYPNSGPYGVEFSPEATKLYVTSDDSVFQFDLEAPNPAATISTVYSGFNFIGALQLGPDGKIYAANTENQAALDIINAPEELGVLCDYNNAGIALAPGTSAVIGLPTLR